MKHTPWARTIFLAGALIATTASSHHSTAGIDNTRSLTVTGTVKEFRWTNPHVWIYLMVPDAQGKDVQWDIEGTSLVVLARSGWKSSSMKPGDKVEVTLAPMRNGDPGGVVFQVKLPSGEVLKAGSPPPVLPAQ